MWNLRVVSSVHLGCLLLSSYVMAEPVVLQPKPPSQIAGSSLLTWSNRQGGQLLSTWQQTLSQAYAFNPALKIAQARLREIQEGRKQAWAEWVPQIQGSVTQFTQETLRSRHGIQRTKKGGFTANQNIFSSFGSIQRLKSTSRKVQATLMNLVAEENKTLMEALQAFLQVYTAQKNLEFYHLDEKRSSDVLAQTKARFEVGEVTLTDVMAQEAKLAASTARRIQGEGNLATARAHFQAVIGREPAYTLVWPEDLPLTLPEKLEDAILLALRESPSVLGATREEEAARYGVNSEMAEQLGPKVDVEASWTRWSEARKNDPLITDMNPGRAGTERDIYVGGTIKLPIGTGGAQSRVRVTEQRLTQARFTRQQAQLSVREALVKAWAEFTVTQQQVIQYNLEVKANTQAFEGAREEYTLGSKNIIDLGIIQDKLVESQVKLVDAEQSFLLAKVKILSLLGRFLTENLRLKVHQYNPEAYNPWFGIGYDEAPLEEVATGD